MANSTVGCKRKRKEQNGTGNKKKKTATDGGITQNNENGESSSHKFQTQIMEKFEEELKCNICLKILITPTVLNCSHMFCEFCITEWKKQQERCPICRDQINSQIRVLALDVYIQKVLEVLTPEKAKARADVIQIMEKSEAELKCNICLEILITPTVLNCSHMFCEFCITEWKKQQERCPVCRDQIDSQIRVLALDVYIEKVLVLTPEKGKARADIINQREKNKIRKPRRSIRLRNRTVGEDINLRLRSLLDEAENLGSLVSQMRNEIALMVNML